MNTQNILNAYTLAKERYAALGIDTDKAIATLEKTPISLHCWQTDDVMGFESNAGLSGGIQTTGNYPAPTSSSSTRCSPVHNASTCTKSTATSAASSSTATK